MTYEHIVRVLKLSLVETVAAALILTLGFMYIEPTVGQAASDTDQFTVTQTVTGAIAFQTDLVDVSMVGSLNGLTGGTSYATATARVTTNNASGYNMTISFSSTTAMVRDADQTEKAIYNYVNSTNTASYAAGFDTSPNNAQFGFSINASNTAEISDVFTGDAGTVCGSGEGTTFTLFDCWRGASSTDETATTELINTSGPTNSSGSTSTVLFRVHIPNGPNPSVPDGTYTATATLTATDN